MQDKRQRASWYANYFNFFVRLGVFAILSFGVFLVYRFLLSDIITDRPHITALVAFWFFSAYIVLPRLNRWLAKLYLPNYFIGRARTADGLLGDPINIAVYGNGQQLIKAMETAGWKLADKLDVKTSAKITYSSVLGTSYPAAPVSPLYLFNRPQQLAFEQQIGGNARKRHHIRFWKTPENWWLPGGYEVDWLGAASLDKNVGLSLFTGQITHKIDGGIDQERDYVVRSLQKAGVLDKVKLVEHFSTSFYARNGGGDAIHTDGALPFITLQK